MILSQNVPDSVKSSGTVLEEPSCTILSQNILDTVKSSRTDLKCTVLFRVYQIIKKSSGTDLKESSCTFLS